MSEYRFALESPWYLLLLLVVPGIWWLGLRKLAALGTGRRLFALGFRSVVLALVILALAEAQMVRVSRRVTAIFLLDQSLSVPPEGRRAMIDYVNAAIGKHRQGADRAGVIVFGREAAIEVPPFDFTVPVSAAVESPVDPEHTNLAAAMRLAQASFPEDAARRIVVVTDGNENLESGLQQAQALAAAGVGIDVVPVRYQRRGEVIVDRAVLPSDIRQGQPFDLKVVVTNTKQPTANDPGEVRGRLVLKRQIGGQPVVLSDEAVTLPPGKKVFTARQELAEAGFFTYEAEFKPDNPQDDTMRQNNLATAFTHVRGKGLVLLIEDHERAGQYDRLALALREFKIEVVPRTTKQPFASLAELQQFDAVILANVPREAFTDGQIQMMVRNTQQMGAGLVMLGGENGFGAGGWTNTEMEKAMPVDFTIKAAKVVPRGALAMIMHASEMPQGNYWQKVIAEEALKALGPRDYCGVIHFGGRGTQWLWDPGMLVVGPNREQMLGKLSRMVPGDMPDFDPGLVMAREGLLGVPDAGVKHIIVISDGDPADPSLAVKQSLVDAKITVSTVAVACHGSAESRRLQDLAKDTGGKYYAVNNPKALPRIFQREARRVAQPLIFERPAGVRPEIASSAEMEIVSGISGDLPPITGFVLTAKKENPLVKVSLISPLPAGSESNRTILASWTYGLGRTVAFTSDGTTRWTRAWVNWENYAKLFGQTIRWAMRPSSDEGKFTVSTDYRDGRVRVVVDALDKDDQYLNYLEVQGGAVGPGLQGIDVKLEQTAPGRYVGSFPARDAGSYMVVVTPGAGKAPLRTGVNVPYSDEFRALETNQPLLEQLAQLVPEGGTAGKLIESPDGFAWLEPLLEVNPFRQDLAKATSGQDIWPFLLLAASCAFFGDVFVRRVQVSFAWVPPLAARLLGRRPSPAVPPTIERLRSRKAEVDDQLERLRAGARFEAPDQSGRPPAALEEVGPAGIARPATAAKPAPSMLPEQEAEEDTYTARLLRAKQKAWEKQKNE